MPRLFLTLLVLTAVAFGLAACGGDDPADLTVYSGRNEELVGKLLDQYEKDSGKKLDIRYGDSADLAATILEEGDNSPADVFFSQDAGALGALQAEGRLSDLPSKTLNAVKERFRSREGQWVGLTARARVIAFDKRELEPKDLPQTVFDVPSGDWKGRVGWAPTNPSFESFVTAMRKLKGDDVARKWLADMVGNDTKAYTNNIAVRDAIANGEIDIGLINHYYVAEAVAEEGPDYPVGVFSPPNRDVGALVNVSGAAILQTSKRVAEARALIDYLLSKKGQEYFADVTKEYPLSAGVEPDPALAPFDAIQTPKIDLDDLAGLQETVKMIQESGAL